VSEESGKKQGKNYLATAFGGIFVILLVKWLWPRAIPFGMFEFWTPKGAVADWLYVSLPLLAWGVGVNLVIDLLRGGLTRSAFAGTPKDIIGGGLLISLWAGLVEEVCFRWLIFLSAVATVQIGNFLIFGWLGFGVPEWFHLSVWGPIADFTTLGALNAQIFHAAGWYVGAAMLYANALFRDGHKYQGLFGTVNSWFTGMFFFWLMFRYGLPAAILVHFLYDLLIFAYAALSAAVRGSGRR